MPGGPPPRDPAAVSAPTRPHPAGAAAGTLLGVAAPPVVFYVLHGHGVPDLVALAAGAVPPLVGALWTALRHRRPNGFALGVLAVTALGLLAALVSGSARELLVRGAVLSAPIGVWTLASLRSRRPLCFHTTRRLLPYRAALMDRLWDADPRFRAAFRVITVMWGSVLLADSGLRVLMAYELPVAVVPALETGLSIATIVALQLPTHLILRRFGVWHQLFGPHRARPDRSMEESHVR